MFQIPEKINAFNVYQNGVKHIGISDEVTLPDIKEITETISGPGILGEIDSPSYGLFGGMEVEVPFRVLYKNVFLMMNALTAVDITLRGSEQLQDAEGNVKFCPLRVVMRGRKKGFTPGVVGQGKGMGSKVKLELSYIKIEVDGINAFELDKLNSIYKVGGIDMLAKVRAMC